MEFIIKRCCDTTISELGELLCEIICIKRIKFLGITIWSTPVFCKIVSSNTKEEYNTIKRYLGYIKKNHPNAKINYNDSMKGLKDVI